MILRLNTFGSSPASIYLVEILNVLDDLVLARKLGRHITNTKTLLKQLEIAHQTGGLTTHVLAHLACLIQEDVAKKFELLAKDQPQKKKIAVTLTANICRGDIKSLIRRCQEVRHMEQKLARVVGRQQAKGIPAVMPKITVDLIDDTINAMTLTTKSKAKLTRQGKTSELY